MDRTEMQFYSPSALIAGRSLFAVDIKKEEKKEKRKSEASKTANMEGVPTPLHFSIVHFSNKHIILLELHSSSLDLSAVRRFSLFTNSK